jgi:hypothetical protein
MKAWLLKKLGVDLEEIRKLRQKCEYQEKWIAQRMRAKDAPVVNHAAAGLRIMQRRVDRLMHERPDVFREYFSKEAPK